MGKRVSAYRIKIHRQYTYQTAANVLGVTVQTVRSWRREGLRVLDSQKPHLILGFDLKEFLQSRVRKPSCELAKDEFLCMSCQAPRRAYGAMADYVPLTPQRGRLEALCEVCTTSCGKFVSLNMRDELAAILTIVTRHKP